MNKETRRFIFWMIVLGGSIFHQVHLVERIQAASDSNWFDMGLIGATAIITVLASREIQKTLK